MLISNHLIGFGAGGSIVPATLSFNVKAEDTGSASSFTFSALSIGSAAANRKVIITVGASNGTATVSSLTVAGNSATFVARQQSSGVTSEIWAVDLATGTTGDVVVNWSGTQGNGCSVGSYSAYGAGSVHDTGGGTGDPASDTLDIPAGGVAVGVVEQNSGTTWTWTGLTERYEDDRAGNAYGGAGDAFASQQTGLTITADASSGGTAAMALASWGPA